MTSWCRLVLMALAILLVGIGNTRANGAVSEDTMRKIKCINDEGPYMGIIAPNAFEMNPLLESPSFFPNHSFPYIDVSGKRFRMGKVGEEKVIVVLTGLSMLNAGITTQLLLSLFRVKGIVHYGIAGNANPQFQVGDVTIPRYWAHSGLWNWQRNGDGPNDALALESNGDYTRSIGYLRFADFNNYTANSKPVDNILNNVWYQPEEIFPVNGIPEVRQHAFWVPVDQHYFQVAEKLQNLELKRCVNSTCLPRKPMVARVSRGVSANVFVDNRAYREFLYSKFNTTPIDMESAAIALVCHQQQVSFITIRALSDLAGGGSALSNEADTFASLAAQNAVDALVGFVALLSP